VTQPAFPITQGPFQPHFNGGDPRYGEEDAFVTKLNSTGSALVYSTYLGGAGDESANGITVDRSGRAYVGGNTQSLNFPLMHPVQSSDRGFNDGFIVVLDPGGSSALFATYFGGRGGDDYINGLGLDASGNLYAGGASNSYEFPTTPGAVGTTIGWGPFAVRVTFGGVRKPQIYGVNSIVSAATFGAGPVAPGELVTLFGEGLGPENGVGPALDSDGRVARDLQGTRVYFDGVPAPILYASDTQVNVVVPYEVSGLNTTRVEAQFGELPSSIVEVPVAVAAPGVFALDPWGFGRAAALNEDGTVNSPGNPARQGSVVVLYATGAGLLMPAQPDGTVTTAPYPHPVLPVSVSIGGTAAEILYAGAAPGLVSGVLQINVRLPADAQSIESAGAWIRIGGIPDAEVTSISIQ